ncbi:iron-siderophore ABC transporter substrate-binding protein [Geminocystis sp. GBBB08]|uniref:ABC transporter substrate-binding protein n=1 Tax=Geminocystis sp. GBBB08 TaxID=2604140 RepID=UPI0027E22A09|nr:iron-siderophore ABC transporter substrate-binding protein [Geminocystis sp. GBBB08]MBL1208505.1 iron-siderophore ABC transporter substrate-binding protein [Geminocystis sp. GBBB08]
MKNFFCFSRYLFSLLTILFISGCNPQNLENNNSLPSQSPEKNCRVIKHELGETCIPKNIKKVIILHPYDLANSIALGVIPIAHTEFTGFPTPKYLEDKLPEIESVGAFDSPNLEKILQIKPDLIISYTQLKQIYSKLSHIAPTVMIKTDYPSAPSFWKERLNNLAVILDKEDISSQLMDEYWKRVNEIKEKLGDSVNSMEISVANTSSEYGIWAYGENHYSGSVLKDIGFEHPESQKGDYFYIDNISLERISDIDGDVLFFVSWERQDDQTTLDKLRRNILWNQLNVVQLDKVYLVGFHWHNSDIFAINAILDDIEKYLVNIP